jgi:RES domain-containing protein
VIVWRICKAGRKATAFDGEGARRYPGRWNHKGVPIVYCASSLALASLEYFVHLDSDDWPDDLVAIRAEVPGDVPFESVDPRTLPRKWREIPAPVALQVLGSEWASASRTVALNVPSAIIPSEVNVLLNPKHADLARVVVHAPEPFAFDPRMRK